MATDHEDTFPLGDWTRRLVGAGLAEDIGPGDATTTVAVDRATVGRAELRVRRAGVVAGLPLLELLYGELDPAVAVRRDLRDGAEVADGAVIARLEGPLASLLTGERTALNFLQHLSGIATLTARYVALTRGTSCRVLDTRKTLPGYRLLAKYAVRCGGGHNHRLGLYDRILLKDNHWAGAGGAITDLVARARRAYPELPIEVEVDDLDQLATVLPLRVAWVLLDNFTTGEVADAVRLRDESGAGTLLEVSGNVTLETIGDYARAGVDAASVGRLTHSAPALDLGLDLT